MAETRVRIRVPFVDVDSSNRIHFTAMFRYMEMAEHALMRAIGFPYAGTLRDLAFPRVHLECDFRGPVRFDDEIEMVAQVAHVSARSWTVAFRAEAVGGPSLAIDVQAGAVLADGRMTIVAMDPQTQSACALPPELKRALEVD